MAKKQRSPNYPALSLEEAVSAVKKIWDANKTSPITSEAAAKAIGYASLSGASRAKLSALRKYGLLEPLGDESRVSKRAIAIIHGQEYERLQALRDAAKEVEIFAELLETHRDASVDALKSKLILHEGFSEDGAEKCVEAFKATLAFARLDGDGTIPEDDGDFSGSEEADNESGRQRLQRKKKMAGTKEDVFSLSHGDVILQWPDRLTREEFEDASGWLDLIKRKLERSVREGDGDRGDDPSGDDD